MTPSYPEYLSFQFKRSTFLKTNKDKEQIKATFKEV